MVNAHTHIYSGLVRLIPKVPEVPEVPEVPKVPEMAQGPLLAILQTFWWRLDRALDARSLRAAARFYVADALAHGARALIDHHESPEFIDGSLDVLADACQELGMPAVLCYGATERNGGRAEGSRGLAECRRFIRSNRRPLVRGIVGLHAAFTVSDDTIGEAAALCRELGTVLHVHVAEDRVDVDDARARGHAGPLERLDAMGALPAGSILAHCVHMSGDQVRMAAARGCWIVQNPRSNRQNGVGYPMAIRCASRVALGTDGFPSDMRAELDALRAIGASQGEDTAHLDARLASGTTLAQQLFEGSLPAPAAAPLPAVMNEIVDDARNEAERVSGTLGTLGTLGTSGTL